MMIDVDPKIKKKKGVEYFELPEDIDEDWVTEHLAFLVEQEETKIKKKFEKENEKLKAEGQKEMKAKELEERLKAAKELQKKLTKENKSKKVEAEGKAPTVEKLEANLEKLDQRIKTMSVQAADKENNKEVSLGTSKIVSRVVPIIFLTSLLNNVTELHRPASHRGLLEKVQRSNREILLEDSSREVRLGHQIRGWKLGVLNQMRKGDKMPFCKRSGTSTKHRS